jgi:Abortive infection alpha
MGSMSDESEALKESAKAAQEIAKAAGTAIEATRSAGGWLDRIFGKAIEDTVGRIWTDRIAARRVEAAIYDWARLLTLLHNVEKKLLAKGIETTRLVPPKVALPLLEHATMENEDDLHVLWENLLAAALDPSQEEIKRTYVSVLVELSARDAHALKLMYAEWSYYEANPITDRSDEQHRYSSGVTTLNDESAVLFYRLGLILPVHIQVEEYRNQRAVTENKWSGDDPPYYVEGGDKTKVLSDLSVVGFTVFGEKFCKAVIGDVSGLYTPPDWTNPQKPDYDSQSSRGGGQDFDCFGASA